MYAVTVEIEAGEVAEGLRLAEQIDHRRSPSIERRVAFLLDQAKPGSTDWLSVIILVRCE
jgi:hypothetical protein